MEDNVKHLLDYLKAQEARSQTAWTANTPNRPHPQEVLQDIIAALASIVDNTFDKGKLNFKWAQVVVLPPPPTAATPETSTAEPTEPTASENTSASIPVTTASPTAEPQRLQQSTSGGDISSRSAVKRPHTASQAPVPTNGPIKKANTMVAPAGSNAAPGGNRTSSTHQPPKDKWRHRFYTISDAPRDQFLSTVEEQKQSSASFQYLISSSPSQLLSGRAKGAAPGAGAGAQKAPAAPSSSPVKIPAAAAAVAAAAAGGAKKRQYSTNFKSRMLIFEKMDGSSNGTDDSIEGLSTSPGASSALLSEGSPPNTSTSGVKSPRGNQLQRTASVGPTLTTSYVERWLFWLDRD